MDRWHQVPFNPIAAATARKGRLQCFAIFVIFCYRSRYSTMTNRTGRRCLDRRPQRSQRRTGDATWFPMESGIVFVGVATFGGRETGSRAAAILLQARQMCLVPGGQIRW